MTIIDTDTYFAGALRFSRHGLARGGNVLTHVASGRAITITERDAPRAAFLLEHSKENAEDTFNRASRNYGPSPATQVA